MTRCIYKIINIKNNKFYVGSAVNLTKRKQKHIWKLRSGDHPNKHLQAAWIKYGETAFIFVLVQIVAEGVDLLEEENWWLQQSVGKPNCYNIAESATAFGLGKSGKKNGMFGKTFTHTPEAKAKIAAAGKCRVRSKESVEKYRAKRKGMPVSEAQKAQISRTLSGEGNFWYGKERSDEFKAKIRKAVVVTDQTGKETVYESIQLLRNALQLKPTTVNRALKSGSPLARGPRAGLSFKYLAPAIDS